MRCAAQLRPATRGVPGLAAENVNHDGTLQEYQ